MVAYISAIGERFQTKLKTNSTSSEIYIQYVNFNWGGSIAEYICSTNQQLEIMLIITKMQLLL